jgi:hypothetical protein
MDQPLLEKEMLEQEFIQIYSSKHGQQEGMEAIMMGNQGN